MYRGVVTNSLEKCPWGPIFSEQCFSVYALKSPLIAPIFSLYIEKIVNDSSIYAFMIMIAFCLENKLEQNSLEKDYRRVQNTAMVTGICPLYYSFFFWNHYIVFTKVNWTGSKKDAFLDQTFFFRTNECAIRWRREVADDDDDDDD